VQVTDTIAAGTGTPLYPVLRYGHGQDGGDAIAGGFVYSGKRIPQPAGKFVFGDISTGRLWWAEFKEMLAADDGIARTMAPIHELQVWWNDPADSPDRGRQLYPTLAPIVTAAYHTRGGRDPELPGTGAVAGLTLISTRRQVAARPGRASVCSQQQSASSRRERWPRRRSMLWTRSTSCRPRAAATR